MFKFKYEYSEGALGSIPGLSLSETSLSLTYKKKTYKKKTPGRIVFPPALGSSSSGENTAGMESGKERGEIAGFTGENRLAKTWSRLRESGRKALIPFMMSGDPHLSVTRDYVLKAAESGADIVELGIPSSDALADGPVVQEAAGRALAEGVTPARVFELVAGLRRETDIPLVLLCYYNQILQAGEENFLEEMKKSGADGLIVPDLPLEESGYLRWEAARRNISFITMATPLAGIDRNRRIAEAGAGFLYCVSVAGVTGVRQGIAEEAVNMLKELKEATDLPLALGFGISTPQQAAEAARFADGVIIGSALIRELENRDKEEGLIILGDLINSIRRSLDGETGRKRW